MKAASAKMVFCSRLRRVLPLLRLMPLLGYSRLGNMTEDDQSDPGSPNPWLGYVYTWDALGRLVQISNRSEQVVAEYRYSADNHRIAWRYPQKTDDAGWYYPVYDHRWRMIAVYRRNETTSGHHLTDLWERFYYHNPGLGGMGGSGYIDSVIARDDTPVEDPESHQWLLTRTVNYVQNWRGDVVALMAVPGCSALSIQTPVRRPSVNGCDHVNRLIV